MKSDIFRVIPSQNNQLEKISSLENKFDEQSVKFQVTKNDFDNLLNIKQKLSKLDENSSEPRGTKKRVLDDKPNRFKEKNKKGNGESEGRDLNQTQQTVTSKVMASKESDKEVSDLSEKSDVNEKRSSNSRNRIAQSQNIEMTSSESFNSKLNNSDGLNFKLNEVQASELNIESLSDELQTAKISEFDPKHLQNLDQFQAKEQIDELSVQSIFDSTENQPINEEIDLDRYLIQLDQIYGDQKNQLSSQMQNLSEAHESSLNLDSTEAVDNLTSDKVSAEDLVELTGQDNSLSSFENGFANSSIKTDLQKPQEVSTSSDLKTTSTLDALIQMSHQKQNQSEFSQGDHKSQNEDSKQKSESVVLSAESMDFSLTHSAQNFNSVQGQLKQNSSVNGSLLNQKLNLNAQDPMENIVEEAQVLIQKGGGEVTLNLNNEQMGDVHLKVKLHEGQVSIEVNAQDKTLQKMIEDHLDDLKSSLTVQNLKLDTLKVNDFSNAEMSQKHHSQSGHEHRQDQNQHFLMNQNQQGFSEKRFNQQEREQKAATYGVTSTNGTAQQVLNDKMLSQQSLLSRARAHLEKHRGSSLNMVA